MNSTPLINLPSPLFSRDDFDSSNGSSNQKINQKANQKELALDKGAVLLFEDAKHHADCYLILEGRVDIRLVTASGHETLLYHLQPGELVGELSLFGKVTRTATVNAASPVRLLRIEAQCFEKAMQDDDFRQRLMHHFLERYVRSHDVIRRLGQPKVIHKIVRYLLSLEAWENANEATLISHLPSHAELAMKLSCQRETVTRSMQELVNQGVIEMHKNGKVILQEDSLRDFLDA